MASTWDKTYNFFQMFESFIEELAIEFMRRAFVFD